MFETYQPNENIQIGGPVPQGKIFCSHSSLRFDLQQTELGIYKRKQESKTTRKQEHDQESDQEKKKKRKKIRSRPRKRQRKKRKNKE